jgi:ribosome-binding protein aMBF1 (putative translation factor)
MNLKYPRNFPEYAKAAVIAEQIEARKSFLGDASHPGYGAPPHVKDPLGSLSRGYILRVFYAFAHQACELGKLSAWTTQEVDEQSNEILRLLTSGVRVEFGDIPIPNMMTDFGSIRPEVKSEFMASREWQKYQDELLEVAKLQYEKPKVSFNLVKRAAESLGLSAESPQASRPIYPSDPGRREIDIEAEAKKQILFVRRIEELQKKKASESSPETVDERTAPPVSQHATMLETIGKQIDMLRLECDLSFEELAEKVGIDPTNVSRHIRGKATPSRMNRRSYERVFSNMLKRHVVINKTQPKRS